MNTELKAIMERGERRRRMLNDPNLCGLCRDCGRPMLPQPVYWRRQDLRGLGAVRLGGHGLCASDYLRARRAGTLPDPAPRTRERLPKIGFRTDYTIVCGECGEVGTVGRRCDAEQAELRHRNAHRSGAIQATGVSS